MSDFTEWEKPQTKEGYDWFGTHWLPVAATANLTHPDPGQAPILKDISDWEAEVRFPDPEQKDWATVGAQMREQMSGDGDVLYVVMLEHGAFERLTLLMGFENALMALYTDTESCRRFAEAMADFKISIIDRLIEAAPIDAVDYHDDMADSQNLFMAPEKWRAIFRDANKRIVDHVHEKGLLFIYHSCGRIETLADDLASLGIDALNVIQACNDQPRVKREIGDRVSLICGLDNQRYMDIEHPDESDLRAEVRRTIDVFAPGGRFFAGPYLPACFCGDDTDVIGIIEDEIARVGRNFYSAV
jgi:uroporphyrinogen-III decarboxylase